MFNRKPYPYKERVVNFYYRYYAKNLAVITIIYKINKLKATFAKLDSQASQYYNATHSITKCE